MIEQSFTKSLIKNELRAAMNKADESAGEYNFLTALGSIRNRAVYITKVITDEEFDVLCQEILDEDDE